MRISASLHAADPLRLATAIAAIGPHVASLHVDVMDGRFAPAFGFGELLVRGLVADGRLPVDVHLMVERPEPWVVRFATLGARRVAFHLEAVEDPVAMARSIRARGSLAYLALLPETPLSHVPDAPGVFDGLLLLTAPAGGGRLNNSALARIEHLPGDCPTIVDGRIKPAQFDFLKSHGVELAVLGGCLFDTDDLPRRAKGLAALASA
jgi:ribulose-phosphate 3-epimerase